jgi:3-hydroxyacyl-[acyl-carrier-protein] dehydratase
MLLENFFNIINLTETGFEINAELEINGGHKIFEGHFPGQPVVPGVCMMQIVKEVLEQVLHQKTDLIKAHEMKFLAIIDPRQNNLIHATIKYAVEENGNLMVSATLFKDELVHFKFKGLFAVQQPGS